MIKINLAKRKKNNKSQTGFTLAGLTNGGVTDFFKNLFPSGSSSGKEGGEENKFNINGPIPKIIICMALVWFVDDYIAQEKKKLLDEVNVRIEKVNSEKTALNTKLAQVRGYEALKHQLEVDEEAIRTKLQTVSKLLENRNASPKMLMQLAQSIPEDVWLTELKVTERDVKLNGSTASYNQVSDFIKNLNATSQFLDIGLSGIQESTTVSNDQKFQNFELNAHRKNGG